MNYVMTAALWQPRCCSSFGLAVRDQPTEQDTTSPPRHPALRRAAHHPVRPPVGRRQKKPISQSRSLKTKASTTLTRQVTSCNFPLEPASRNMTLPVGRLRKGWPLQVPNGCLDYLIALSLRCPLANLHAGRYTAPHAT